MIPRRMKKAIVNTWCRIPSKVGIPVPLPYGGWTKAHFDEMGFNLLRGWRYENELWRWLDNWMLLHPTTTAIDVGASQGFYTRLLAKHFDYVIALEPNYKEYLKLQKMMSEYSLVRLMNVAAGSSQGVGKLITVNGHESRSSLAKVLQEDVRGTPLHESVGVVQLDNLTDNLDLIKLDCEGSEIFVLEGAKRLIKEFSPLIICEIADVATEPFGYKAQEIVYWLKARGYNISYCVAGRLAPFFEQDYYRTEIIAIHESKLEELW